jgi:uncharacterized protein YbjQ (UPF0145 family)
MSIDPKFVSTGFEFPGYRIAKTLGVVRGIVVRSRSIIGTVGASLQTLLGGNITLYTEMCERARADAHQLMIDHAAQLAANAIIGLRQRNHRRRWMLKSASESRKDPRLQSAESLARDFDP